MRASASCVSSSSGALQHNAHNLRTNPAAAVQHNAHVLRTPKHEGLYRYGRRCGRSGLLLLFNICSTQRAHALRTPKHVCGAARFHMYKYQAPSAIIPEAIKHVKQFPTIRRRFRLNVGLWEVQT